MPLEKLLVAAVPETFKLPVTESAPMVEVAELRASIVEVAISPATVVVPAMSARPETDSASVGVVVAIPSLVVMDSIVVVAEVVVAFTITRLVMVEVELLTRIPPESVARPVAVIVPMFDRLPDESILAVPPVWTSVEALIVGPRIVPVAVKLAERSSPENRPLPVTAKA